MAQAVASWVLLQVPDHRRLLWRWPQDVDVGSGSGQDMGGGGGCLLSASGPDQGGGGDHRRTRADSRRDSKAALLTSSVWPLQGTEDGASPGPCPERVSRLKVTKDKTENKPEWSSGQKPAPRSAVRRPSGEQAAGPTCTQTRTKSTNSECS